MNDMIEWRKSPITVEEYAKANKKCAEIKETKCAMKSDDLSDNGKEFKHFCDFKKISQLDGQDKRMVICDDVKCPKDYPWTKA